MFFDTLMNCSALRLFYGAVLDGHSSGRGRIGGCPVLMSVDRTVRFRKREAAVKTSRKLHKKLPKTNAEKLKMFCELNPALKGLSTLKTAL